MSGFGKFSLILAPNFNKMWWEKMISKKFSNFKLLDHNQNFIYKNKIKFQAFINDQGEMDSSLKISSSNKCVFLQSSSKIVLLSVMDAVAIQFIYIINKVINFNFY